MRSYLITIYNEYNNDFIPLLISCSSKHEIVFVAYIYHLVCQYSQQCNRSIHSHLKGFFTAHLCTYNLSPN